MKPFLQIAPLAFLVVGTVVLVWRGMRNNTHDHGTESGGIDND